MNTKRFLAFVASLLLFYIASAQETDPWVGTWTSESYQDVDWDNSSGEGLVDAYYKRIIRITKTNDGYSVRSKLIKVGDPDYTFYNRPMVVKKVDGSTIWLESYIEKEPFSVNDKIDSYRDVTYRFKLTLKQGLMHFSYYEFDYTEYDRRMAFKESGTVKVGGAGSSLELFTDDW